MKSPFKFLDSFTKEDSEIFFGRRKETEELYQHTFRGKIMLVYGVSGTGKSSLINCGLANKFRNEDWLPVNVRRGNNIAESMYAAIVASSLNQRSPYAPNETQFRKQVKALYLDHYRPVFFIFDQFEELFIFGSKEERNLLVKIIKSLVESDIQCRFIFVMREEYMANLTEFERHIPSFLANRVRIENMDINNAMEAITGPCKVYNINVETGFPEALIENLSPGSPDIELTYLQVYLDKIYRLSKEETEGTDKNMSFTVDQLRKAGNVSDLLGSFLNEQISLLEDPDTALAVLKSFVSFKGTKRQMNPEEVIEYAKTLGKPVKDSDLIGMLQNFVHLRILRDKDQYGRYELRHDSLATKIFDKISVTEKDILEIRQFIEDGYHNWQKRGILLNAADLEYIAPYESRLFLSSEILNYINQSKNQVEKAKQKKRVFFATATSVLLLIFAGFTVWALIERSISRKNEVTANGNYYNALSKELVNIDPTKALRVATYAYKIDPSEDNYQNLANIYSGDEFYFDYKPTSNYTPTDFKVLNSTNEILLLENNRLKIIDKDGKLVSESSFSVPSGSSFDVSPDEKSFLIYQLDDSIKLCDRNFRIFYNYFRSGSYLDNPKLLNDKDFILIEDINEKLRARLILCSADGSIKENNQEYEYGSIIHRHSVDSVFYLTNKDLYIWLPYRNVSIKRQLEIKPQDFVTPEVDFLTSQTFACMPSSDSIKIYNINGKKLAAWYTGDNESRDYSSMNYLNELDVIICKNKAGIRIWNTKGMSITKLKLEGSAVTRYQYYDADGRILILLKGHMISYMPDRLNINPVLRIKDKNYHLNILRNNFIEFSRTDEKLNLISLNDSTLVRTPVSIDRQKNYFKIPGCSDILNYWPDSIQFRHKNKIVIYSLDGSPLFQLKDSIRYPYYIRFANDGSWFATAGELEGNYSNVTYFSSFRLYKSNGENFRTVPVSSGSTEFRISSDDKSLMLSEGSNITLRDSSAKILKTFPRQASSSYDIDLSEDNKYLLACSFDKTVKLWSSEGTLLKVLNTESDYPYASFLPGEQIFQIFENHMVKLYNIKGALLQKIPANSPVMYHKKNRSLYFPTDEGIFSTKLKIPVDTFILSNNYSNLSLTEKIDFKIQSGETLMKSGKPSELYQAALYYQNKINGITDVTEIKKTIRLSEKMYRKGLSFDTLHSRIGRQLTSLYYLKDRFFTIDLQKEIDKCYHIMTDSRKLNDLTTALNFYGRTLNGGSLDSLELRYGYCDKILNLSREFMKLYPENKLTRQFISRICSNMSFGLIGYKEYSKSLEAVRLAIEADSTNQYSYTNLPLAYLFNNNFDAAASEYNKWKDKKWSGPEFKTYREGFLLDLEDFENKGITHPDFAKVRELLKK